MPAMQTGDIYTMLCKLDKHGISTDNVMINLIYAGFTERKPDPPIVFWLQQDLARLDPMAFNQIKSQLEANKTIPKVGPAQRLHRLITQRLAIYRYKDFIKADWQKHVKTWAGQPADDSLGDSRPWYQKTGLKELLAGPSYQNGFAIQPFDMSGANPQIYFLEKIIAHQQDKNTLFFLAPVNPELVAQFKQPGYQDNLLRVERYFAQKKLPYMDFNGQVDPALFSDHVHLIGAGYAQLAGQLGGKLSPGDKKP